MHKRIVRFDEAVAMVADVIAEYGRHHRYEKLAGKDGCYYGNMALEPDHVLTDDEAVHLKPGCIWGHALSKAGILPLCDFAMSGSFVDAMLEEHDIKLTEKASAYMRAVQNLQDGGGTWGEAHDAGIRKAELGVWMWGLMPGESRRPYNDGE